MQTAVHAFARAMNTENGLNAHAGFDYIEAFETMAAFQEVEYDEEIKIEDTTLLNILMTVDDFSDDLEDKSKEDCETIRKDIIKNLSNSYNRKELFNGMANYVLMLQTEEAVERAEESVDSLGGDGSDSQDAINRTYEDINSTRDLVDKLNREELKNDLHDRLDEAEEVIDDAQAAYEEQLALSESVSESESSYTVKDIA